MNLTRLAFTRPRTSSARAWSLASLVLAASLSLAVQAQELTLFEPVESGETMERPDPRTMRQERADGMEPRFTLVGTSRIGDTYRATLRVRGGETVVVEGAADATVEIPGHAGYRIAGINGRNVSLLYPGSDVCVDFPDRGVNCSAAGNSGSLSLVTAAAVPAPEQNTQEPRLQMLDASARGRRARGGEPGSEEAEPTNPFAAALRAAAAEVPEDVAERRAEAQRFQGRRIDPADVPQGQRLIRTPFGDRLIAE